MEDNHEEMPEWAIPVQEDVWEGKFSARADELTNEAKIRFVDMLTTWVRQGLDATTPLVINGQTIIIVHAERSIEHMRMQVAGDLDG